MPNDSQKFEVSKRQSRAILTVLFLLYMLNLMDQQVIASVLELIKRDLGLTDAQAGMLSTSLLLSTTLLAIPCSMLVDRWSRRKGIGLMAVVWSAATFATGLGTRFIHLLVARFVTGIGESGYVPGSNSWLSFVFPKEKRGRIMGLYTASIPIGLTLGVVLGGGLAKATGTWRTPFYFFAIPGIILGIICFFLPDYATVKQTTEQGEKRSIIRDIKELLKIRSFVFEFIGSALYLFMSYSFLVWLPAILQRAYGIDEAKAGAIAGISLIVGIISSPLAGVLADKWLRRNQRGRMYFACTATILMTIARFCFYLSIGTSLEITAIFAVIDGFITPMTIPIMLTVVADVSPPKSRSTAGGFQNFIVYGFGAAWGPVVIGALSDSYGGGAFGLQKAGLILCVIGLLSALMYWLGSRYYADDSDRIMDIVSAEKNEA